MRLHAWIRAGTARVGRYWQPVSPEGALDPYLGGTEPPSWVRSLLADLDAEQPSVAWHIRHDQPRASVALANGFQGYQELVHGRPYWSLVVVADQQDPLPRRLVGHLLAESNTHARVGPISNMIARAIRDESAATFSVDPKLAAQLTDMVGEDLSLEASSLAQGIYPIEPARIAKLAELLLHGPVTGVDTVAVTYSLDAVHLATHQALLCTPNGKVDADPYGLPRPERSAVMKLVTNFFHRFAGRNARSDSGEKRRK